MYSGLYQAFLIQLSCESNKPEFELSQQGFDRRKKLRNFATWRYKFFFWESVFLFCFTVFELIFLAASKIEKCEPLIRTLQTDIFAKKSNRKMSDRVLSTPPILVILINFVFCVWMLFEDPHEPFWSWIIKVLTSLARIALLQKLFFENLKESTCNEIFFGPVKKWSYSLWNTLVRIFGCPFVRRCSPGLLVEIFKVLCMMLGYHVTKKVIHWKIQF